MSSDVIGDDIIDNESRISKENSAGTICKSSFMGPKNSNKKAETFF